MLRDKIRTKVYAPFLWTTSTIMASLLIVLALLFLFKFGASAATPDPGAMLRQAAVPAATIPLLDCASAATVPALECQALADLYTATDGAQWISQTNWLTFGSNAAPCDWYGVTCSNGHITELVLARNQLSGTLPLTMGDLSGLTRLHLEANGLTGRIPPTICKLAPTLTDANLAYNGFFTRRTSVERCLQTIDADWLATQTTLVTDLRLTEFYTNALRLAWTPIVYTDDGGYYEISLATNITGPYIVHGQTTEKLAATYLVDQLAPGRTYYLSLRAYTPPHGNQPSELRSNPLLSVGVTKANAGRALVIAYFPADNNLASEIGYVVERFRRGTALNPNVKVVLLVDGRQDDDTRLLEMAGGQITTTTAVEQAWGVSELDTGDPAVLTWFLQYARTNYPAPRTIVTLMGHGVALAPEIAWPPSNVVAAQSRPTGDIPPLPKEHDFSPSDVTNRGYMSTVDVGQALMAATNNGADPFDVVYFDQCFQGSLDALYEVHKTARVFVASPNYAWLTAAYDKYISQIVPTATPAELAQSIINLYQFTLDQRHPNSIFWVRGNDIPAIADAASALGDALLAATNAGETSKIISAVQQSKYVDTTQCGRQNFQLGPPDELIGVETFAQNLQQSFAINDAYGVYAAVDQLRIAMAGIEKRTLTGHPYIAPQELWDYRDTLTLLAPLLRNSPSTAAWRASIHRPDAPFTATWTIDPTQTVTVTSSLAYVREGRWDEFLANWYQNLTPTVGQWCHYRPAQQIIVAEPTVITLTVALSGTNAVALQWNPVDDETATSYWLYAQDPYDIGLAVRAVTPITQTTLAITDLPVGISRFSLLARNDETLFVAQSNEVLVDIVAEAPDPLHIYLPWIEN